RDNPDPREGVPEEVVPHLGAPPFAVVHPAVVRAGERAVADDAERQLQLAVGAPVLERVQGAVLAAEDGDGTVPERDVNHLSGFDVAVPFDGVPVVGAEAGGADALPVVSGLFEGRGSHAPLLLDRIRHGSSGPTTSVRWSGR